MGNGMAGARTVEEILARGGRDLFDITMIGDEPYGNYNRIMLSPLLAGEKSFDEIVLNAALFARQGVTVAGAIAGASWS